MNLKITDEKFPSLEFDKKVIPDFPIIRSIPQAAIIDLDELIAYLVKRFPGKIRKALKEAR